MNRGSTASLGMLYIVIAIINDNTYAGMAFAAVGGATLATVMYDAWWWRQQWRLIERQIARANSIAVIRARRR